MKKLLSLLLCLTFAFSLAACNGNGENSGSGDSSGTDQPKPIVRVDDARNLSTEEYTVANATATDKEGRVVRAGNTEDEQKFVGLFYHIWHGNDSTRNYGKVYDITELVKEDKDFLTDIRGETSPIGRFHYWGQPLYGYYCSYDPYIIRKHCELLTTAGVDYLIYDTTNANPYVDTVNEIYKVYQEYYDLGWDVPKITFYCNTSTLNTVRTIYETWYKKGLYKDLWFSLDGKKPLIVGVSNEISSVNTALYEELTEFFDFRESQWPYGHDEDLERGFPWMDWEYPQKNYNGTMSVSLAQHPGARMSEERRSNNGRGFDYSTFRNKSANADLGTNFAGQFDTVFENNKNPANKQINNVFITGFNEWKAIKYQDGQSVYFVDTYSKEYSRDIEMMKGGYEDNYYLQMIDLLRKFKYGTAEHYNYNLNAIDIEDGTLAGWQNVKTNYRDFTGDAAKRNFSDACSENTYVDDSGRNDIANVSITHDKGHLYVKVTAVDNITEYNGTDENWMTLLIKTDDDLQNSFGGYKYIINRKPDANGKTTVEKSTGGYNWQSAGEAEYRVYGNTILYKIPLTALGLTAENCYIQLKANDHVTQFDDIMDYYVTGDSAPIGRLGYAYGY